MLLLSIADLGSAIRVLQGGGLYSAAVSDLEDARTKLVEASRTKNKVVRDVLIDQAIAAEVRAKAEVVGD